MPKLWAKSIGARGSRVRIYQSRRGGTLMRSVYLNGKEDRKSLGHRDRARAIAEAYALLAQLNALVDNGNTVIVVEHDMRVAAAADWLIDIGPGAGDEGGRIVAQGPPAEVAQTAGSRTAPYLRLCLGA